MMPQNLVVSSIGVSSLKHFFFFACFFSFKIVENEKSFPEAMHHLLLFSETQGGVRKQTASFVFMELNGRMRNGL